MKSEKSKAFAECTMSKKRQIYDVSAELEREFGPVGSAEREQQTEKAWEEYNAQS